MAALGRLAAATVNVPCGESLTVSNAPTHESQAVHLFGVGCLALQASGQATAALLAVAFMAAGCCAGYARCAPKEEVSSQDLFAPIFAQRTAAAGLP